MRECSVYCWTIACPVRLRGSGGMLVYDLPHRLLETVIRYPHKTAVSDPTGEMTFTEVFTRSGILSKLVEARTRQSTVGLLLPSSGAFVVAYWAVLFADKTPVLLLPLLKARELKPIASDSGIDLILSVGALESLARAVCDHVVLLDDLPADMPQGDFYLRDEFENEVAALIYTSGSTGLPKGVELSHMNLLANAAGCERMLGVDAGFKLLSPLPLTHAFALTTGLVLPFCTGASVTYTPRFVPGEMLDLIIRFRPNAMFAVPSMFKVLLAVIRREPQAFDLSSLEFPVSGAEALPRTVAEDFRNLTGRMLLEGYGLTEASPVVSVNTPDASRPGSVGKPLYNVGVKIIDDSGAGLAPGREGEICVRGPAVMRGYRGRPRETREAIDEDGWLHTGDLGFLDEDGFLHIVGRKKELIISAGENIHPAQVEAVVCACDGVAEAAVVGIPDASRGEVPVAFVVAGDGVSLTEGELKAFCREHLSSSRVPRKVMFVDALPKGPTGKVLRTALKQLPSEHPTD